MFLPDLSIRRPVLAFVMSAILVIFGIFSYRDLSVREYPDIDAPIVSVTTQYRGASATIIESQVTQVIEDSVSGINGVRRITSQSREESSSVSIEFTLERDIEDAANDVRAAVSRVTGNLPDEADPPQISKTDSDARPILWLGLSSARLNGLELTDYAERFLVDRFTTVPGVANVRIGGERRYSMRVWLNRLAMAAREITVQDVERAVRAQNVQIPAGRVEMQQRELSVKTRSDLTSAQDFAAIVVAQGPDYLVRLGDIAHVEVGPEQDRVSLKADGEPTIGLGIVRQSKGNTLAVANAVKELVEEIRPSLPDGVSLAVSYDQSIFIERSIQEVFIALGIAMTLVVSVIFLFLRSARATIIPAVAIPVSIIATVTVLAALDYSVNVLTLLALVLAIGLVVDDAIVVLENVHRRIELGEPPLLAASRGTRQVGFAVIATTIVLISVFLPLSFLEGNTGRLFREFGVAVATAVLFSSFVALSLTPMLCSKLLRPAKSEGIFYRTTESLFQGLARGYRWLLRGALAAPLVIVALAVIVSGVAYFIFEKLPKEHAPLEDRGVFFISVSAPNGSSFEFTRRYADEIAALLQPYQDEGLMPRIFYILGSASRPGPVDSAFFFVRLSDWAERPRSQQSVVSELFPKLLAIPGVRAFAINPPSLGLRSWGAPLEIVVGGPSYEALKEWTDRIVQRAEDENPRLLNVDTDFSESQPQLHVNVDRNRAADLGISIEAIGRTLETMLGGRLVTTFEEGGKLYNVVLRARPEDRVTPDDLSNIYVRSERTGMNVPLGNLLRFEEAAGASVLNRVDRLRSITVSASLADGYTLDEALRYMEGLAAEELPAEARVSYGGVSREFKESSSALLFTFAIALLIVFLALAAQFESFIHPLIIMVSVPLAVTGALGSLAIGGLSLNVYSQIGIVMLIGLTAKNAILIVEFANQLRDEGLSVYEAVLEASVIRLRPILMTTISTALGALPLAIATGAGAESREAIGVVIVGGVSFSTVLSLFVVPVFYLIFAHFTKPAGIIQRRLHELEARHRLRPEDETPPATEAAKPATRPGPAE
ncbi:efflux RND transporter permease subunit [Oceanibacterium hippocampi]|uniref:Multidrug resistance protein MexB n=1 Tax=Oceanibacterium hippocampi TaxID=745714 RepID=A0A1Y5U078_9PROT|nr:efflux RND transporter permease subunit [Oceanibacterium hippocampi]SLN72892.1 Multidrug resistance protein MexB [Oceanibacterium hippocampi]